MPELRDIIFTSSKVITLTLLHRLASIIYYYEILILLVNKSLNIFLKKLKWD